MSVHRNGWKPGLHFLFAPCFLKKAESESRRRFIGVGAKNAAESDHLRGVHPGD